MKVNNFDKVILKNIYSIFSIRIVSYLIPLVSLPYLVRVLGVEAYGTKVYFAAIVQYFILIVNFGFDLSATQKISIFRNNKEKISEIFWNVQFLRLNVSLLLFIVMYVILSIIDISHNLKVVFLMTYISVFGSALYPQWLFQGKESLGTISIVNVVAQLISLLLIFTFVKQDSDLYVAALISSLVTFFVGVVSLYIIYLRKWIYFSRPTWKGVIQEIIDGWPLFLSTAAINLYTTSVTVILGAICGTPTVAIYTAAERLFKAVHGLYFSLPQAYYPRISLLIKNDYYEAIQCIRKLLKLSITITFIAFIAMFIFSEYFITILYGKEFLESIYILKIFSILPLIISISNVFGVQCLVTHGYKSKFTKILMFSGVINIILLIPLAYHLNAAGAAYSVVLTELVVTVLMYKAVVTRKIPIFSKEVAKNV